MGLSQLNNIQQDAVLKTDGPLMILAGAGSGKTRTLVSKVAYLIKEKGVGPYQLLALTFSNKAAREMRERVSHEVDIDIGALQVTTFHAFCAKILRSEANYIGLTRSFTIYDTSESKAVAKNILGRHGIGPKEINPYEILSYIDDLKNNGHYIGRKKAENLDIDYQDVFYSYYKEYEDELHRANAVDFGGLITGVLQLFESFPEVLERYQKRFKYILVDEYQDTNRAQFELICQLSQLNKNICVVGDEDQSIYSWRGADIRNILDFEKTFPDTEVIKLEQNYRSSANIIRAAGHVIEKNSLRKGKTMWTENPEGESIQVVECPDEKKESEFVANEINLLVTEQKTHKGDIAVFYRTNAQSRIIEEALRKLKINYRVVGGVRFYERKEIKDVLAYMRLVVNPKDSLALSRIINVPARGVGATTLRKIEDCAVSLNLSLWESLTQIVDNPSNYSEIRLSAKVKSSLSQFVHLIEELMQLEKNKCQPSFLYEKILHESGLLEYLNSSKDYETQARIENLEELANAISQYEEAYESPTLVGYLETITLDTHVESEDSEESQDQGEVSLMTAHGAKGLEFPYVFILGAEENVFPSYQGIENGEMGVEEERRLFYVAMTRAMKRLYICFAHGRMLFGQLKFNGPSRFIDEIPEELYGLKRYEVHGNEYGREESWDDFSQETYYPSDEKVIQRGKPQPQSKFFEGCKVMHGLYGIGKVLKTEGTGQDEKVLVLFSDGAKKRFMVKFAPLEMIK